MKRNNAIVFIRSECATNGDVTDAAMRVYCESRISYQVFQQAIKEGVAIYKKKKETIITPTPPVINEN